MQYSRVYRRRFFLMRCLLLSIRIEELRKLPFLQATPIPVGRLRRHHRPHTCHASSQNTTTLTTPYFIYFIAGPFTSYYGISNFNIHRCPLIASQTLSLKKPSVSRRPSHHGQQFQSSTSTPTTFIITHPPTKHRAHEARRAASTRGQTGGGVEGLEMDSCSGMTERRMRQCTLVSPMNFHWLADS